MEHLLGLAEEREDVDEEFSDLRRAILLCERETTRSRGERRLDRIAQKRDPRRSPIAMSALAASAMWKGDLRAVLYWGRQAVSQYPMSPAAVWCSTLLISVYRMLGMKRERFEAEQERFRMMRKIAFQGPNHVDRIYALNELRKELESRDLTADAERCAEELRELIGSSRPGSIPPLLI